MEDRVEKVESNIEENVAKAVGRQMELIKIDIDFPKLQIVTLENYTEECKFQLSPPRSSIKLSTFNAKASWKVFETHFSIVEDASGWDSKTKACHLAASLRDDAADVLQTLPENQRLDFQALTSALELRFGKKCLKDYSSLQLKFCQQKTTETL